MSRLKVVSMSEEGGYVVQGTQDVLEARAAALGHRLWGEGHDWDGEGLRWAINHVHGLRARVGLFRWTPCSPRSCYDGGGHRGHLGYAKQRGRGVFEGVYLMGW